MKRTVAAIRADRYAARHAPAGWLYAARFDHAYIDGDLEPRPIARAPRSSIEEPSHADLARLVELRDPARLHAALEELVRIEPHDGGVDPARIEWREDRLNIVVVGAGPIGLAVASALLVALGSRADVLVVDDRVSSPNRKRPYDRRWLTAIDRQQLEGIVEDDVRDLLARLGTRQIGVTIRVLETLLFLSCRRMGAHFHFAQRPDLRFVGERPIDVVFDATGNRLRAPDPAAEIEIVEQLDTSSLPINRDLLSSYGVDVRTESPHRHVEVASTPDVRFPLVGGKRLAQAMVKVVGIPARLCRTLVEHLSTRNHDNKHYVWRGSMRDEINEGLILLNLTRAEYDALCTTNELDERTRELLDLVDRLATREERARIELDAPFVWRPYWIDERTPATLHGTPLVRVGDSVYNGNVKLANGLSRHLLHVAHVQRAMWQHATSMHAELVAHSMGRLRA